MPDIHDALQRVSPRRTGDYAETEPLDDRYVRETLGRRGDRRYL